MFIDLKTIVKTIGFFIRFCFGTSYASIFKMIQMIWECSPVVVQEIAIYKLFCTRKCHVDTKVDKRREY